MASYAYGSRGYQSALRRDKALITRLAQTHANEINGQAWVYEFTKGEFKKIATLTPQRKNGGNRMATKKVGSIGKWIKAKAVMIDKETGVVHILKEVKKAITNPAKRKKKATKKVARRRKR